MAYLGQTTLEVDTTKVYDLDGQEVYLTIDDGFTKPKIVVKDGFDKYGRDTQYYNNNYQRRRKIRLKYER